MKHQKKFWKRFIPAVCAFLMVQAAFSHGSKDVEEINVETLESWQESFTLEGKKKGKYNILVTATDLGGNEFIEGPYNIYVDPKSDLPVCGITNPHQDMRIMGNLNIVGTCVDDDAVQYVDLILDGDEEHPVRASGKEFWSYYLDTTELSEGVHSIKVIGTDINGLAGNPVSLTWNLDRRQPVTEVQNRSMGELVSGTVKFSGAVSDGNGIKNLAYSVDNGETFKDIRLSEKKGIKYFTISVDTRKFKDGPAVIWFKALDNAGSTGVYSFLYFIDNTKPDIQIVTPEEKEVQYGKVAVSGIAKDAIGVTKLTWTFGKETGEFELVPGNPYWSIVFDTIGSSDASRKFTITGEDRAGNVVSVSRTILLNQKLDKPVVEIAYPTAETFLETNEKCFVRGIAKDREGIQSVKYRIDNNDWIIEETKGVFCGDLIDGSELSPGKHTVTVVATDRNGVEGDPFSVSFTAR
ncbi:MAG: Ig-like domain-containing protein, partial [Treponema porcinum]|nr:Ig-like domain-containing protein [Treponema porcinum]